MILIGNKPRNLAYYYVKLTADYTQNPSLFFLEIIPGIFRPTLFRKMIIGLNLCRKTCD
jgi:hypothetical protein